MSIYYLKDANQNKILNLPNFEKLDEALIEARKWTKKYPRMKIEVLKCMGLVQFIETQTGEHEEIFFN
jgi:hypothetical protein